MGIPILPMPDKHFIIDTNVIISVAIFSSLNPALAIKKALSLGNLVFSEPVLQEYAETLSNPKFDAYLSPEKRLLFLNTLIADGLVIKISNTIKICRDPKDDKYLELAVASQASCIITGDKDLLVLHPFEHIPILTPTDFLNNF